VFVLPGQQSRFFEQFANGIGRNTRSKEEAVQEVQSPLPSGVVIQGRYIVESLLGKGERLGRAYILMGYFEEPTLEMLRLQQPEKRFPLPKATAFMIPVIDALHYLHQRNPPAIHQNINPTSIIVSPTLHVPVLIMLDLVKERDSTTTTLHSFAPRLCCARTIRAGH
jgi:serine/threonine protein kinase